MIAMRELVSLYKSRATHTYTAHELLAEEKLLQDGLKSISASL